MPLEELEDATRILEGLVADRRAAGVEGLVGILGLAARGCLRREVLVLPTHAIVRHVLGVVSGEETVEIFGVPERVGHDRRGVRVVYDVLAEFAAFAEDVVDDAAEERDVGARPDRHVARRDGARAREARIDVDHLRALLARRHHPLEADGMALGHVRPHDEDAVGELQILLERGRAAATE